MKYFHRQIVTYFLRFLVCVQVCQYISSAAAADNHKVIACGKRLGALMDTVCKGRYNTFINTPALGTASKRSSFERLNDILMPHDMMIESDTYSNDDDIWYADVAAGDYNEIGGGVGHGMLANRLPVAGGAHRLRRGIVDECCHKPCSLAVLYQFCS